MHMCVFLYKKNYLHSTHTSFKDMGNMSRRW